MSEPIVFIRMQARWIITTPNSLAGICTSWRASSPLLTGAP